MIQVKALDKLVTIEVSENVTQDVAGNKNSASNLLEVRHCMDFYLIHLSCLF
jgi:hypothetical protein